MNDTDRFILTAAISVIVTTTLAACLVMLQVDTHHQVPDWLMASPALLPGVILFALRLVPSVKQILRTITAKKQQRMMI